MKKKIKETNLDVALKNPLVITFFLSGDRNIFPEINFNSIKRQEIFNIILKESF